MVKLFIILIIFIGNFNKLARFVRLGKLYRLIKMTRLVRVLRIVKERNRLVKYLNEILKIGIGFERLVFFILMFIVICHIVACLWYFNISSCLKIFSLGLSRPDLMKQEKIHGYFNLTSKIWIILNFTSLHFILQSQLL